jgi:hypothetical protein
LGLNAGVNLAAGSNNVYIANQGVPAESGVTRIGTPGTQAATYIAGIRNVTPGVKDAAPVVIDSNGQLGTGLGSAIVYLPSKDSIPANSFTVFSQSCPSDHPVLMGGGCGAGDNDRNGSDVTVNYSGPAPFSNQMVWRCQATNSSSAARALPAALLRQPSANGSLLPGTEDRFRRRQTRGNVNSMRYQSVDIDVILPTSANLDHSHLHSRQVHQRSHLHPRSSPLAAGPQRIRVASVRRAVNRI